ncbi:Carnitine O-palmitoyltransferase 2, mitochondrial [Balamuthia mandrillaris]
MCRGRMFVLKVPRMDIARRIEEQLHVVEKVEAILHRITASSHHDKKRTASKYETTMMGYLTCAERDEAAAVREELEKEETNLRSLLRIQKALFVVCLDQHNENEGKEKEVNEKEQLWWYRKTCNYIPSIEETVCNRWFEKALQIVVTRGPHVGGHCQGSSAVRIALHVEHAALDSGVVHKFASYLYAYINKLHHHQSLIALQKSQH